MRSLQRNYASMAVLLAVTLYFTQFGFAQSKQDPATLGEAKYQELKAKGLLPQPKQVQVPKKMRPENIIAPDAIERGRGLLIPLDQSFIRLQNKGQTNDIPSDTIKLRPRDTAQKPSRASIPPGYDRRHIEVKFLDEIDVALDRNGLPKDLSGKQLQSAGARRIFDVIARAGGKWERMAGASKAKIDSLRGVAEKNLGRRIANLDNYYLLTVTAGVDIEEWVDSLNALPEVEIATPLPLPVPPPTPPDYQSLQGYLNSASDGIDAQFAWTLPGGTGTNTTICDLEYSWNLSHQDLPSNISTLLPSGYTAVDPFNDKNHGTAVLGEMVSLNNGWGTTGIAYGASVMVAPTYLDKGTGPAWLVAKALANAIASLANGDVILIEQQWLGPNNPPCCQNNPPDCPPGTDCQFGLVPVEWDQSTDIYNWILTAIGNGIHVVEAAGNGSQNLDDPVYNTGHRPFLSQNNSGAVIVGAGAAPNGFGGSTTDRSRLWFSNYGSRVDLQGWGEAVRTTGYGDVYSLEGANLFYTNFSGTSSASPIVASAVAVLESMCEANGTSTLGPFGMRWILESTGSAQQAGANPLSQNIGPRPNLRAALGFAVAPFTNGTPPAYRNDDGSTSPIPLSFGFSFYGTQYSQIYLNNNGNLSFEGAYWDYTPAGFPISGYAMVAAFWGDVDTRNSGSGLVYYKSDPHRFIAIWDRVGYYGSHADKLNTFELIITDGTDTLVGVGKNVCFSYGDMQWTTGDASSGSGGFGGAPATVGVNKGDGTNYALVGRFDHEGTDYDGPGGNSDGVSYLDRRRFTFNVAQGIGTISGTVFGDENGNCVHDGGEVGLPGWTIRLEPGSKFTTTDANGEYFFSFLAPNTYTVSQVLRANWQQTCPAPPGTHTVVLSQGQTVTGKDFGDRPSTNVQDLAISVAGGFARPGFQKFYGIKYENKGTVAVSSVVATLTLPAQVTFLESSPGGTHGGPNPGGSVTWALGSVPAGDIGWLWAKVQIPNTLPLNTTLTSTARIDPLAGDANSADNVDVETEFVRGSFDPNEKQVTPAGIILPTDTLTYLIEFQNTGTDTAFNIAVRDLLDTDLDVSSVQPGASSHPYAFGIVDPGELVFTFSNINLPDSNVNEPASHGFVQFRVLSRSDVWPGADIANTASIFFDFNPAVLTNTVHNQIAAATVAHGIALPQGWNMNSSFVAPQDSTLDTMLVKILPHLVLMKNGAGQIYTPLFGGMNTIGKWNPRHGYKVYVTATDTLWITGIELLPDSTPLPLAQGWNLSAYLRNSPMRVDSAVAGIVSNVVVVKNNAGQVYTPLFGGINTIGQMKPGQGYQIYLTQASTLTYPANTGPSPPSILTKQQVVASSAEASSAVHYASTVPNTGGNAVLFVETSELKEGDEVAVWTEKKMLVGSGVVTQGRAVITIWGDNSITEDIIDGALDGESLSLTVWSAGEEKSLSISSLTDALTGEEVGNTLHYKTDGVWIARGVKEAKEIPTTFSLSQNYPNPFNPSTTIKYGLPRDVKVRLEVYNVLGQRVAVLVDEEQKAGYYEVLFQNSNLASGVYFYRLSAGEFAQAKKLMLVR
jgi:serine protease